MVRSTTYLVVFLVLCCLNDLKAQYTGGNADGFSSDTYTLTTCGTPDQFYAYGGGSGDGSAQQTYTLTSCGTPDQFYAYSGGSGDGFATQTHTLTSCGTPNQFYAYAGGSADGFATQTYTLTSCGTPAQFYAYSGGSADGFATQTFTQTTCGTPTQFYAFMGGSGDGFARDTLTKCPTAPPTASFTANSTTVCAGATVNFTDQSTNSPSAWSWIFQGGTPSTYTVQNPSVVYNTPGTYSVSLVATNAMGTGTYTVANYITVNAIPTANAGSDVSICIGSSTSLTATGGGTYSWTPGAGLSATNISNPVANPTVTTTYSVTATINGCSATDAVKVTVNPIPTANAGSDVAICLGSSTTLLATGGTSYSWAPATALNSTIIANPVANPTNTTTYTVTVSAGGCSSTDQVIVTVNSLPTANAGSDQAICRGSATNLAGTGGPSYSWSPSTGLNATNIANPVASPTSTVNYTLTVTDVNNCSASDVMTLTVNPLPLVYAGSDITMCSGASATLTATGANSYTWSPSTALSAPNIPNPVTTTTASITYTVTGIDNNGCVASDNINVTITSSLTANAGSDVAICNGSSTVLSASGGTTYSWTPATGLSSTIVSNPTASPAITTTYVVTASSGGCSATDQVVVTVNPLPTVTVTPSGPLAFCQGGSVTLSSSAASTYSWNTGATSPSITVTTQGNYYVTVTNSYTCSTTSPAISVTVHPQGTASITPTGATTFCQGGSVTLNANSGAAYSWSGGATSQSINVTSSGTYTVSVDDVFGCTVPSPTASIVITVNPNPATPTITANGTTALCTGDTVTLSSTPENNYLWNTGATTQSILAYNGGTYSVTVTNTFGCSTGSGNVGVSVDIPLSDFVSDTQLVFIPGAVVNFTATTTGHAPYTYSWSFGDGGTSGLAAPSYTYNTVAYDTVSLTVTDSMGCSNTITKPSYIEVERLFPSTPMVTNTSLDLTSVAFIDAVTGISSLTDGNCILSTDSGNTWTALPTGQIHPLKNTFTMVGDWFAVGDSGTIIHSTNNGASWTPFATGTYETFNSTSFTSASVGFAVGTNGIAHAYNGSSWSPIATGVATHLNSVDALANGDAVAVGDAQTILYYNGSWSQQTSPLNFDIRGVRFFSTLGGYAAGTGGNVLRTSNGGATWTPCLTGVDIDFNTVEVEGTNNAWASGTHGIVYVTGDGGSTWIRYSVGDTTEQSCLKVSGGKGHIVGQGGNGRNFLDTTHTTANGVKAAFTGYHLYPNPAKDQCTVSGNLLQSALVVIEVKDAQGRLVDRVMNEVVNGEFSLKLNTMNYQDGVYFVHVREGTRSWVQKLVITR